MNKVVLLLFLFSLAFNSVKAQTATKNSDNCRLAERLYRLEEDSTRQGSPQSQALLDSAIKLCPGYSVPYMEKSVAFNKTGDFFNGFLWLNKAVEMDPLTHMGYRGWIKLRKLRDFKGAEKDLKEFDQLSPNDAQYAWGEHIYYLLGECKLGMQDFDSALYYYKKYIQLAAADRGESYIEVYAFVYAGIAGFQKKQYSNASIYFDKALNYYGNCAEAFYYKALILFYTGREKEARIYMYKAKENFEAGYYHRDKYNEYLYQLYLSDITESIRLISEKDFR